MDAPDWWTERLTRNELVTRALNGRLEEDVTELRAADVLPADPGDPIRYLCECSDPACRGRFAMTPDRYEAIHARNDTFAVLPGHEQPSVESVVDSDGPVLIVRKRTLSP